MIELLAIPAHGTSPTSLDRWTEQFVALGHFPVVTRDGSDGAWIEIAPMRLRGFAVFEGKRIEAINFELHDPDPAPALNLIESAANSLGWELYPDDGDEDDS